MGDLYFPIISYSENYDTIKKEKEQLEVAQLRAIPIAFNFDYMEYDFSAEMITLNAFLKDNFGISFLTGKYDEVTKEVPHQDVKLINFPSEYSDSILLEIQAKINRFHFNLIANTPKDRFVIVLNKKYYGHLAYHLKVFQIQYFNTKEEALESIGSHLARYFDANGTYDLMDRFKSDQLTARTKQLLIANPAYKTELYNGDDIRFFCEESITSVKDGVKILLDILESINRKPFEIVQT